VSAQTQASGIIANRYVGALIDLAEESKALKAVEKDFSDLSNSLKKSNDLQSFVRSPLLSEAKQINVIEALAKKGKFNEITTNFLKVLVSNRRLNILADVLAAFDTQISKRRGEVIVQVETAQDLSAAQIKNLQEILKKETGADIALNTKVSPEILGGMVVTVGSHMIDDSIARKLERLKTSMSYGANENVNLKEVG